MIIRTESLKIPGVLDDVLIAPRENVGRPPALYMPSAALAGYSQEAIGVGLGSVYEKSRAIADQGFKIIAPTTGFTFGVSGMPDASPLTGAGQMEASIAYHGVAGPAGFYAVSMGTANSIVYALNHPGQVKWMVLFSPAYDLAAYYASNFGGNRAALGTAWGVTYPTPLPFDAQIMARAAELVDIPILMPYANDDGYSFNIEDFADLSGAEIVDVGAVGHGDATVAAFDTQDMIDWIQEKAAA